MLPVNFNTSAVTSLNILKSVQNIDTRPDTATTLPATGPSPFGTNTLSPTTAEAILRINELVGSSVDGPRSAQSLSELPAAHAGKLRGHGDSFVKLNGQDVDRATFEKVAFETVQGDYGDNPAFAEAVKNGSLKIMRPSEVAGLGEGVVVYDTYSNGERTGSVSLSNYNSDFFQSQIDNGLKQVLGYHERVGSYYVTWPE